MHTYTETPLHISSNTFIHSGVGHLCGVIECIHDHWGVCLSVFMEVGCTPGHRCSHRCKVYEAVQSVLLPVDVRVYSQMYNVFMGCDIKVYTRMDVECIDICGVYSGLWAAEFFHACQVCREGWHQRWNPVQLLSVQTLPFCPVLGVQAGPEVVLGFPLLIFQGHAEASEYRTFTRLPGRVALGI